jgi:hypothetical protein
LDAETLAQVYKFVREYKCACGDAEARAKR